MREHNARAWLAWFTAALPRAKRMPKLDKMLINDRPRVQTWQEQLRIIRVINAMSGGRDMKRDKKKVH